MGKINFKVSEIEFIYDIPALKSFKKSMNDDELSDHLSNVMKYYEEMCSEEFISESKKIIRSIKIKSIL